MLQLTCASCLIVFKLHLFLISASEEVNFSNMQRLQIRSRHSAILQNLYFTSTTMLISTDTLRGRADAPRAVRE